MISPINAAGAPARSFNVPVSQLVRQHYPAFRELRSEVGRPLPSYVQEEFEAYLKCGRLEEGGDLNEAEAQNILRGQEWALRSRTRVLSDMLSDEYLLRLHKDS